MIGPRELGAIAAEKKMDRSGTVTLSATLTQLMQVEPIGPVSLLVGVELISVVEGELEVEVPYFLDEAQLMTYDEAREAHLTYAEEVLTSLRAERERFEEEFSAAARAYEADRGKYGGKDPTSGDLARKDREAQVQNLKHAEDQLQGASERLPMVDDLRTQTDALSQRQKVEAVEIIARVRILDAKTPRLIWLGKIRVRDYTLSQAMERFCQTLLAEMSAPRSQILLSQAEARSAAEATPTAKMQ